MKRVRGIIIKDGRVLTFRRTKSDEIYWVIPGGGVENGEDNEEALLREIKEELGVDVKIGRIIFEMDSQKTETLGQREYFYLCDISGGEIGTGQGPEFKDDGGYIGSHRAEWLEIGELKHYDLRPSIIKLIITNIYE